MTILLATDGSYPALVATEKAVSMAKQRNAELIVLKVVEQMPMVSTERFAEDTALQRPIGEDGTLYATMIADESKVPVKVVVREGAVVGEILRAAEEVGADAIVLGTSSLKGFNRLYLGSVAGAVVAQAPVSVTVVKPTSEEIEAIKAKLKTMATIPAPMLNVRSITRTKAFRVGVYLFVAYAIGYALFTLGGSYFRSFFRESLFGLNVGTVAGMTLIALTILLALGFNFYADRTEG